MAALKKLKTRKVTFTITCDKCGSSDVEIADTLDSDMEDGAWGAVTLVCRNCGAELEIARI